MASKSGALVGTYSPVQETFLTTYLCPGLLYFITCHLEVLKDILYFLFVKDKATCGGL
jgi:hypothetical protein